MESSEEHVTLFRVDNGVMKSKNGVSILNDIKPKRNTEVLINEEELPFYLKLIEKFNANVQKKLRVEEIAQTRRKTKIMELLEKGDIMFVKAETKLKHTNTSKGLAFRSAVESTTSVNDEESADLNISEEECCSDNELPTKNLNGINPQMYPNPEAKFPECTKCKVIFKEVAEYKEHMNTHHMKHLRYKCDVCAKLFLSASLLRQHQRYHGEKKFKCATCGEGFPFEITLTRHERVHSKEKPYVCSVCSRSFSQTSNLKNHEYTHSQTKNFECISCGTRFLTKYTLLRHCRRKNHVA